MASRLIAHLRILSNLATLLTVCWTCSTHSGFSDAIWVLAPVLSGPLWNASLLWTMQFRSPLFIGARLSGTGSQSIKPIKDCIDRISILVDPGQRAQLRVSRDLHHTMYLLPLNTDWIKLVPNNPLAFIMPTQGLDFKDKLLFQIKGCKELCYPYVCYAGLQGHAASPSFSCICILSVNNIKWVHWIYPTWWEDFGDSINFIFYFDVIQFLKPWLIYRKPYWGRDLFVQVNKFLSAWDWAWHFY